MDKKTKGMDKKTKGKGPGVKDIVNVRATRMGFLGTGSSMRRVRPGSVLSVSREFFDENAHWLAENKEAEHAEDKREFDKRPVKMDVI